MMFLGGDALEGPRHIWWNFVSSSKQRIEQAKQDWKTGQFAAGATGTRVHSAAGVSYCCAFSFACWCPRQPLRKPDRMNAMLASDLPLPRIGRGKVRDIYAVGDDRVLLLTTDRISAFDVVMAETIPMKGAVLTQISAWWFRQFEGVVPHHMISADADEIIREVPELKNHRADIAGRAMLCRRTTVFPVECVIRGYISGSAWKEYAASGTLAGEKLKAGLVESEKLDPRFSALPPRPRLAMTKT